MRHDKYGSGCVLGFVSLLFGLARAGLEFVLCLARRLGLPLRRGQVLGFIVMDHSPGVRTIILEFGCTHGWMGD
jgi:hypothetical protein